MHPIFILTIIGCAGWFFAMAAMAGKGIGARVGYAILGAAEFMVIAGVLEQAVKNQRFFRKALGSGPDMVPILLYIVLPAVVVVFLSGLWLRRILGRSAQPKDKG